MIEDFSIRLKKALREKNMKPSELSKKTGIKAPMISDYLKGKYKAKQDKIYLIAEVLDVSEAWLMGFDVKMDRIPENQRKDDLLQYKISKLSEEQKDAIISIIDNMK